MAGFDSRSWEALTLKRRRLTRAHVDFVLALGGELFVDWAMQQSDPDAEGIEAGRLPKGAIVGTNGFGKRGYSICPPGKEETYMFAVYALPKSLSLEPGLNASQTRQQVLDVSGNVGLLPVAYARG